jgi:DNA-binding CsgD family transcriptional regulator
LELSVKDESENQGYPYPCADDLDVRILGLMCEGMPDIAISRQLGLGMRTVQRRIGRMMKETGSPSRFTFGATLYRTGVIVNRVPIRCGKSDTFVGAMRTQGWQ